MQSILYQNLNPKAKINSKTFPNTQDGLRLLGEFLLNTHYLPWQKKHSRWKDSSFEWFYFSSIAKMGLDFLKLDEKFFHFKLTLVDSEE